MCLFLCVCVLPYEVVCVCVCVCVYMCVINAVSIRRLRTSWYWYYLNLSCGKFHFIEPSSPHTPSLSPSYQYLLFPIWNQHFTYISIYGNSSVFSIVSFYSEYQTVEFFSLPTDYSNWSGRKYWKSLPSPVIYISLSLPAIKVPLQFIF